MKNGANTKDDNHSKKQMIRRIFLSFLWRYIVFWFILQLFLWASIKLISALPFGLEFPKPLYPILMVLALLLRFGLPILIAMFMFEEALTKQYSNFKIQITPRDNHKDQSA